MTFLRPLGCLSSFLVPKDYLSTNSHLFFLQPAKCYLTSLSLDFHSLFECRTLPPQQGSTLCLRLCAELVSPPKEARFFRCPLRLRLPHFVFTVLWPPLPSRFLIFPGFSAPQFTVPLSSLSFWRLSFCLSCLMFCLACFNVLRFTFCPRSGLPYASAFESPQRRPRYLLFPFREIAALTPFFTPRTHGPGFI